MQYFKYGQIETDHLTRQDERLGSIILKYGKLNRRINPNAFQSLIQSIIAQQISSQAASTVYKRMEALVKKVGPREIAEAKAEEIQKCGMTHRKVTYIKGIAQAVIERKLDLSQLPQMPDENAIKMLTALPGVGRWTAEMLLLHALERPNIFSYDDLIIRRSLRQLHDLSHLNKEQFRVFKDRYSPYGSVAMIYLWQHGK
ncbi:MAG: DNA-3-methyladenine glycosylase 2 family protein [Saprospiraceae bacterium]|nr:DNA-3-methyladenine glycosylase 2 family protein [Saprospiraceae bacterium]